MEIERSLFVLLPRLPLRLWLGVETTELGRDRELDEFTDWYTEAPALVGVLAADMDLVLRASAILFLRSSEPKVVGVADRASAPAWTGTCL